MVTFLECVTYHMLYKTKKTTFFMICQERKGTGSAQVNLKYLKDPLPINIMYTPIYIYILFLSDLFIVPL